MKPGQPFLRRVRVEQAGQFRNGGLEGSWNPFTSVQHFSADPPGFVWDAAIRMAPLMTVRVRDSSIGGIGGIGGMQANLASLFPIVNQKGGPELNAGALHRYLAEAVWFPTALLPGHGMTWEAIDETSSRATLTHAGTSVSLDFHFGEQGEVVRVYTPERFRDVGGKGIPTPWEGRFSRYAERNGMMVPLEGEVAWILPEGHLTYWRGRVLHFDVTPNR